MKTRSYRSYDLLELTATEVLILRDALREYDKTAKRMMWEGEYRVMVSMVEHLLER